MAGGRPCKLTPAVQQAVCDALRAGATHRMAAEFAGVGDATMRAWMASTDTKFRAFQAAVKESEARGDVHSLAIIQKAAKAGQWQAAAWMLERRHPAEYGRRQIVALQRAAEPDMPALQAAAARGISAADAAVLFQRQLAVLESSYQQGHLDAVTYLERMDRLTAQATRLAELTMRGSLGTSEHPQVELALTIDSPAILQPGAVPDTVRRGGRAVGGGDLIDVG